MNFRKRITHFASLFLITIILAGQFLPKDVKAKDRGIGRIRSCTPIEGNVEGMDFDPTTAGKDVEFVMSNPLCLSVMIYTYASVKAGIAAMNSSCGSGSPVPRLIPSPFLDALDITKATAKAVTGNVACQQGLVQASMSFATAIGYLGAIYEVSKSVYNTSRVCGANWKAPNPKQFLINNPDYKGVVDRNMEKSTKDPTLRKNLNLNNKLYREWYYGGVEVEDSSCPDVTGQSIEGKYPPQRYYLKGYETGNYNCKKYDILPGQKDPRDGSVITPERLREYRSAYNCCASKAQNYLCIEYKGDREFCKAGSKCEIKGIYFEAIPKDNGAMICGQSYSLCPYNFYLGGGSPECDYYQDGVYNDSEGRYNFITLDNVKSGSCSGKSEIRNDDCTYNEKAGKCKNYCQYMRHCTKTNSVYKYKSTLGSAYFSAACINFVGDSQNRLSYGTGFILGSARHFTTPIAQCVRETLENVFYNRAGHTRCKLDSDVANSNGQCENGTAYKKGDKVESESFFDSLQKNLKTIIKMILTLSVTFLGMKILLANAEVKKSELFTYILKFGIVSFFALGSAWQVFFFDGVYNASSTFAQIVFKIQMPDDETRRDGCQFGITSDSQGNPISAAITYPKGKEYLAIWDTLDCKIARYLGFGPEVSVANIAKLIIAGYITGPIGIYFSMALLFFGFLLIEIAIKALHIFLGSTIAIILMVFISPITITAMLFSKTEGIFKNWLKQLIGFSLQPMILFAYIAIFISIMDKTLIGSASFHGAAPMKTISCSEYCVDNKGNKVDEKVSPFCDRIGDKLAKPKADSFACLIDANSFANWPGLELIGVSLPFIVDLFTTDAKKKILTIIKGALIMYFLNKFMSEIPGIASQLVGGGKLPMTKDDASGIFRNVTGLLRGIQKRGGRVGKSKAAGLAKGAARMGGKAANAIGNRGKSTAESDPKDADSSDATGASNAASDSSGDSKGSGSDSSGKGGSGSGDSSK